MTAEEALLAVTMSGDSPQRGCMVVSDLCGSTAVLFANAELGAGLQAAHEAICSEKSGLDTESPQFKAMGDGVMMEVTDPLIACRIALDLLDEAKQLRNKAVRGGGNRGFSEFHLKIAVAAGEFRRAAGSQRWLGLLPTKATRIAAFARPDEVWIDNEVAAAVRGYLKDLNAVYDHNPGTGAAFFVPLKGLDENLVTIHLLRRSGDPCPLSSDEQQKMWLLPWSETMVGLKQIVEKIQASGFSPQRVVGIGRSGAILGGIIAGNLDHVAVDVIERRHLSERDRRAMSTLTEPEEIYVGSKLVSVAGDARPIWDDPPRMLLVIGEAKTESSFHSA